MKPYLPLILTLATLLSTLSSVAKPVRRKVPPKPIPNYIIRESTALPAAGERNGYVSLLYAPLPDAPLPPLPDAGPIRAFAYDGDRMYSPVAPALRLHVETKRPGDITKTEEDLPKGVDLLYSRMTVTTEGRFLLGRVHNGSDKLLHRVAVDISFEGLDGQLVGNARALMSDLRAGQDGDFIVPLESVPTSGFVLSYRIVRVSVER